MKEETPNNEDLSFSCILKRLAEGTLSNWWQRMRLKNPSYLVEGGPLTHDVARASNVTIRKAYLKLEKMRAKGLVIKHGGRGGICRWWPAEDDSPYIPEQTDHNTALADPA